MNSNNIELLLMTDNNLETVGGEQESTKIIINGLSEKYKVAVIQPGNIKQKKNNVRYFELSENTRLKHLIKKPLEFIEYIMSVKRIINKEKPEIIHTQSQVSFFIVSLLKKLKLISGSQYIIHTERGLYKKYNFIIKKIFIFFMSQLNTLVTTTEFNMTDWKKVNKNRNINYEIIENTAGDIFERLDVNLVPKNKGKLRIGFSGRYAEWKDWPLAVEIAKEANRRFSTKIEIFMTVGCLDEKSEVKTEKMFIELKNVLGDRFQGKINVDMEEMNKFYYNLDVFILTSRKNTESFGRTLVEAMSRLTAVLTTDAGGSVEVVGNKNVFSTSEQFVNKISEYLENEDILIKEKNESLTRVRKLYSLENNITKHKNMYRKILESEGIK